MEGTGKRRMETVRGRLRTPQEEAERPFVVERRLDPVTGCSVRLTEARPLDRPEDAVEQPDISPQVEATKDCAFCPGRVEVMTPRFPRSTHEAGRLVRNGSVLFPNLAPYGRHSAVCIFSRDHHVPLGTFTRAHYEDALTNCLDYLRLVEGIDPEATRQVISQNILPSSGGALLHPHLQVNADPWPMNYHRLLLERQAASPGLLDGWAAAEAGSPRSLGRWGPWELFTAYAPMGLWEVHGVAPGIRRLADLDGAGLRSFVEGTLAIHRFWASRGRNAANMALFATTEGSHPLFVRYLVRSAYEPWYRSDRSCYEVGMLEPAGDCFPEPLAEEMRAYLESP